MAAVAAQTRGGGGVHLEDFQVEFVGPLITVLLTAVGAYCYNHWEKIPDVGLLESVVVAISVAIVLVFIVYIPNILYTTFSNKFYASLIIILIFPTIFVLSKPAWMLFEYFNGTAISDMEKGAMDQHITTSKVVLTELAHTPILQHMDSKNVEVSRTVWNTGSSRAAEGEKPSDESRTIINEVSQNNNVPNFEGDCVKYSKMLLSNTVLTSPRKYHIKGQVEMFKRTVHLTGKPSVLALVREPKEYSGTAMDISGDRHHNTEGHSSESARDAVEKALIKICEVFRTKGFHVL